jgi:hypothetical protein
VALEGTAYRYRCTAYDDYAGAASAEGDFVLGRSHWDGARKEASFEPLGSRPFALVYTAFDGETIYLAGSLVLVPDGWISYPDEAGGEKRYFVMGAHRGGGAVEEKLP